MTDDEPIDFSGALWRLREIKAMREVVKGKQAKLVQPEEMETQGGSQFDFLAFHLSNGKWSKRP